MSIVSLHLNGDFGNQCMQVLHGLAYCERQGAQLQIARRGYRAPEGVQWLGEMIFDLAIPAATVELPERHDPCGSSPLQDGEVNVKLNGYQQHQGAMIYTAAQARRWFRFRSEVDDKLRSIESLPSKVFHVRHGNFMSHGMVVVSRESYVEEAKRHGYDPKEFVTIEEGTVAKRPQPFEGDLGFLGDFYRLMRASVLFRSNSSFAWTAALLGGGRVFSPVIEGKQRFTKADCQFAPGNAEPLWSGDGVDRRLEVPGEQFEPFESFSQAQQDRFVLEVLVKPERLTTGTFVDIGAHHPTSLSNTYALERLGWRGFLVERERTYAGLLRDGRKSTVIEQDARHIDWSKVGLPSVIDYLSLDVDEFSMDALLQLPTTTRFRVLTVEHNAYMYDTLRGAMRDFLTRLGYERIVSDVRFGGNAFEDWWIDPATVPPARAERFRRAGVEAIDLFR